MTLRIGTILNEEDLQQLTTTFDNVPVETVTGRLSETSKHFNAIVSFARDRFGPAYLDFGHQHVQVTHDEGRWFRLPCEISANFSITARFFFRNLRDAVEFRMPHG